MVSLVLGAAHSFSFGACELRWGVGKLHGATLVYRKATKRQESKDHDWQRYVLGSPAMVLEEKTSQAAAALCTAIPGEDRAPQHTAFSLHTRLPTLSCKSAYLPAFAHQDGSDL